MRHYSHPTFPHTRSALGRLGQRGKVLLLLGFIYCLIGVGLVIAADEPTVQFGYAFWNDVGGLSFWGGGFFLVGVVSLITAFYPLGRDSWGFMALAGLTTIWTVGALFTAVLYDNPRAYITTLVWGALSLIIMLVSGMKGVHDD